jgi:hypothetical protein
MSGLPGGAGAGGTGGGGGGAVRVTSFRLALLFFPGNSTLLRAWALNASSCGDAAAYHWVIVSDLSVGTGPPQVRSACTRTTSCAASHTAPFASAAVTATSFNEASLKYLLNLLTIRSPITSCPRWLPPFYSPTVLVSYAQAPLVAPPFFGRLSVPGKICKTQTTDLKIASISTPAIPPSRRSSRTFSSVPYTTV